MRIIHQSMIILLFLPICYTFNVSLIANLTEFRVGHIRNLDLLVEDSDVSGDVQFSIRCADETVCKISSASIRTQLIDGETKPLGINATIEAVFLGITDIVIFKDGIEVSRSIVRVLRAEYYQFLSKIFTIVIAVFVIFVTFMMGTQLELKRIKTVWSKPIGPAIGFFCQFCLNPLWGYTLATYGLPDDQMVLKLALFAASTCPGGGKSSFWTIIFGGNLDLSVSMTFTQTIAAMFMMPLWLFTLGRNFTTQRVTIPFVHIAEGLLALLVPSACGMLFIHFKPHLLEKFDKWIKRATWFATIFFTVFGLYANWYVLLMFTWPAVICGCLLPWSGYIIAFVTATVLRQDLRDSKTIAIETGIQNVGIATILMIWCLPEPEVDISLTVLFVIILATDKPLIIIYLVSKIYRRCFAQKSKEVDESTKINQKASETSSKNDKISPVDEKSVSLSML